jgi:hypothetical protein
MRLPAPATVISCIALFVALGGTGYAVTQLPRDSVGSAQLKPRAVKETDIGNRAVVSSKLAEQAVTREKLAPGAVTADRVATDALTGAQIDEASLARVPFAAEAARALTAGRAEIADRVEVADRATRATSAANADRAALADEAAHAAAADHAGVADALSKVDRNAEDFEIADPFIYTVVIECDAGLTAVAGGLRRRANSDLPFLVGSYPDDTAWVLELFEYDTDPGVPLRATGYAVCVEADGT